MEPKDTMVLFSNSSISSTISSESTTDKNMFSEESSRFCSENYVWIIVVAVISFIAITAISISVYFLKIRKNENPGTNKSLEEKGHSIKKQVTDTNPFGEPVEDDDYDKDLNPFAENYDNDLNPFTENYENDLNPFNENYDNNLNPFAKN